MPLKGVTVRLATLDDAVALRSFECGGPKEYEQRDRRGRAGALVPRRPGVHPPRRRGGGPTWCSSHDAGQILWGDAGSDANDVIVTLADGPIIRRVEDLGTALHWSEIDEDLSVAALLGVPEDVLAAYRPS